MSVLVTDRKPSPYDYIVVLRNLEIKSIYFMNNQKSRVNASLLSALVNFSINAYECSRKINLSDESTHKYVDETFEFLDSYLSQLMIVEEITRGISSETFFTRLAELIKLGSEAYKSVENSLEVYKSNR